jgi:hypothetical protein
MTENKQENVYISIPIPLEMDAAIERISEAEGGISKASIWRKAMAYWLAREKRVTVRSSVKIGRPGR